MHTCIPDDGLHEQTAHCHSVTAVRTLNVIGTFILNVIFVTYVLTQMSENNEGCDCLY